MRQERAYWKAAHERYYNGPTHRLRKRLLQQRSGTALRLMRLFDPVRTLGEVAAEMKVSKQAVHQELLRIFYKIDARMRDPNFKQ